MMHIQENYLPVVQGTSLTVQDTTLTNDHSGENRSHQKLIIVSKRHSATPKEICHKTVSVSFGYTRYSFSGYLTTDEVPLGTFIDIYA